MLIISAVLAVLPLIAIAYMFAQGSINTVDNLFYILILLAMSGIFALNAYLESRDRKRYRTMAAGASAQWTAATGFRIEGGLVESVIFLKALSARPIVRL